MSFAQEMDAIRRLAILKLMIEDGGLANDGTLLTALRAIGHVQMMDQTAVRRLLRELAQRDLVEVEMVRDTVMVAKILEHGRMAAAGHISVGGVASPHAGL